MLLQACSQFWFPSIWQNMLQAWLYVLVYQLSKVIQIFYLQKKKESRPGLDMEKEKVDDQISVMGSQKNQKTQLDDF
jgi:hypothetical protein